MKVTESFIPGCFVIEPEVHEDTRGYFLESFNQIEFEKALGIQVNFVQDNEAKSSYGVIRGLHFQKPPYEQAKLVRVIEGNVLDVVLDLRQGSETFGKYFEIEISGANKKQVFVPRGCAHGYSVLSETAIFSYKCDNYYHKESESGIAYNDTSLNIDWRISEEDRIVSLKDQNQQSFEAFLENQNQK